MNRNIAISLALLAAFTGGARAQLSPDANDPGERSEKIHYLLILPEEKVPEVVKPSEPNPFSKADTHIIKEDGASGEENRVREILANLPITGYADGGPEGQDAHLMLGPMKLRRGDLVPPVLTEQSVRLRVNSINRDQIDLIWVEKKNKVTGMPPRVVTFPVHIAPKIRTALATVPTAVTDPGKKNQGNFILKDGNNSEADSPPPETRRATAVDSTGAPPSAHAEVKADADHPANLLMNMLFKSVSKPVEAPPPAAK